MSRARSSRRGQQAWLRWRMRVRRWDAAVTCGAILWLALRLTIFVLRR